MADDWLDWLRLGQQAMGVAGGMGAFNATGAPGSIVPPGDTLSGPMNLSGAQMNLQGIGGATPPGAPAFTAPSMAPPMTPPPAATAQPNLGLPQSPIAQQGAPPPPVAPTDPYAQTPLTADAVNAVTSSSDPRSWWQRNVSDPTSKAWDKAWAEDPKTGLSPAMKALAGMGTQAAAAASAKPAAPQLSGGGGGGQAYRPAPINAAQMALTREQQLALLKHRAQLNAPWLRRFQQQPQQGLMG